ncbi:(2Fe-2S)-binding protein [Phytoactinopolyspora halotolerans]|uniref:(2Fe-2S)-binding protein n=1 Tax=Phytoactinopolyspora halotolerans TaxID=1981512 RepID=A0A6L9SFX7_9ACTN|nr:(2Fe-2S)-binding protein [Phytoactinopolyspora halotolerans]NEE03351.1 (2Fe-2S)-binding protein [Phytoactinopolyspora halotolerans]
MPPRSVPPADDPIRPDPSSAVHVTVDGVSRTGRAGQTIAGILLTSGELSWRRTSQKNAPRGVFCGIGVCFDCVVTVNGQRDVRACQRRAADGDVVDTQHDALPAHPADPTSRLSADGGGGDG